MADVPHARPRSPVPMLGEHSREVLAEVLGVSDEEYAELVALGITGDMPPD